MKFLKAIFLLLSILLIFLIGYSIINTYVSLKYEIDVYGQNGLSPIGIARDYVLQLISTLKFFLCYVIVNVILIFLSIWKRK